jgi:ion channel-forming bestrophin family protein
MIAPTLKEGFTPLIKMTLPTFLSYSLYSGLILILEKRYGDHLYSIPPQVGSVFGIAVAFFLGFRMNSAYDRWWEARKNIGELASNSRAFTSKVYTYFQNEEPTICERLIEFLCLYIVQLKNQVHDLPFIDHLHLSKLSGRDLSFFSRIKNPANQILKIMSFNIEKSLNKDLSMEKYDLMVLLNKFHEIQGKIERTKETPFLNIYKAFTRLIVISYILLLPFFVGDIDMGGEGSHLELLAIPIVALLGTVFLTVDKLSNLYGEPFSLQDTSFSLTNLSQNIVSEIKEYSAP